MQCSIVFNVTSLFSHNQMLRRSLSAKSLLGINMCEGKQEKQNWANKDIEHNNSNRRLQNFNEPMGSSDKKISHKNISIRAQIGQLTEEGHWQKIAHVNGLSHLSMWWFTSSLMNGHWWTLTCDAHTHTHVVFHLFPTGVAKTILSSNQNFYYNILVHKINIGIFLYWKQYVISWQ